MYWPPCSQKQHSVPVDGNMKLPIPKVKGGIKEWFLRLSIWLQFQIHFNLNTLFMECALAWVPANSRVQVLPGGILICLLYIQWDLHPSSHQLGRACNANMSGSWNSSPKCGLANIHYNLHSIFDIKVFNFKMFSFLYFLNPVYFSHLKPHNYIGLI